jgi:hypothetical protein
LRIPIDTRLKEIRDLPYTISFVLRKRMQIDNLSELPKEKRPPDSILWEGTSEDLDDWLDRVFDTNKPVNTDFIIDDIEG